MKRTRFLAAVSMLAALAAMAQAPVGPPPDGPQPPSDESAAGTEEALVGELKFSGATIEIVLNDYAEKTGRTLLLDPKLPKASVTLRSQGKLAMTDYLHAIDAVLSMNGIAVLKVGSLRSCRSLRRARRP
jgi:type II secretory pathway component GspD/PulD (secretin)